MGKYNGKSRKQKAMQYDEKYSHIPKDYNERLAWMYDCYNINDKVSDEILRARTALVNTMQYSIDYTVVLYEEPEGAQRPRVRLVNKSNLSNMAMSNSEFIHVYSPTGAQDNFYMRQLVSETDFAELNSLICTPCAVEYNIFIKTPNSFNRVETFLAEIGAERPVKKPDWDNIGKKYCDMYNANVWLDDILTIDGAVHKYYSILPRVEIHLRFMNMLYNKYQYDMITKRKDYKEEYNVQYFNYKECL